jgi:peptide/nickel transport system permease protein
LQSRPAPGHPDRNMSIGRFILRRALFALLLVFVVSSGALVLTRMAPGDATSEEDVTLTRASEARARIRAELGLDRPLATQYFDWLLHAVRLDFGRSVVFSRPVGELLAERARNTAVLAVVALLAATLLGIPVGVYTGSHPVGALPTILRAISVVLLSVPPLIGSLLLVLVAARTGWFPIGGMTSLVANELTWSAWLSDLAHHVTMPVIALAAPLAATLERLQSQSIDEARHESFVRAALARGTSPERAIWRHAWPVSLGSVLGLYGVAIGSLLSGSFVVEVVTAWPGLGRLMYDALRGRDVYLVAGCAATGALFLAIGTFGSDLLLAVIDPRRRTEQQL